MSPLLNGHSLFYAFLMVYINTKLILELLVMPSLPTVLPVFGEKELRVNNKHSV